MTSSTNTSTLLNGLVLVLTALLSACGGGSSSTTTSTSTPTPAAPSATPSPAETPAATPSPAGTPSSTSSPTPTPTPTPTPVPAPTPTASECPISNYKSDVLAAINAARAVTQSCGSATGALIWNGQLESAAAIHSNDMAANNYFAHPDANGVRVGGRTSATGYSYRLVGENIAGGQTSASQVVADWMASPSHCTNIMTASHVDLGVSCKYSSTSTYQYYWTLVMGNR